MSANDRLLQTLAGLKRRVYARRRFRPGEPLVIKMYRGYRSSCKLFFQGRVLEQARIRVADGDSRWRNMINALRRFETDEVAGATVELDYRGHVLTRVTDAEGYFTIHEDVDNSPDPEPWETITARITRLPDGSPGDGQTFHGSVADLTRDAELAIVTDIDDTILQTGVTSLFKLRALYRTIADNAYTRLPFAGAAELFAGLSSGATATEESNPVFYLSNSPWNLYGLLREFLDLRGFPKGPIFLRDVGLPYAGSPQGGTHKELTLERLLVDFPTVQFVLIGDSGEADADIYHAAAARWPERVKAVVIRNVKNNANARRIERMFARVAPERNFMLVRDSVDAAERLAALGLLDDEQVARVANSEMANT